MKPWWRLLAAVIVLIIIIAVLDWPHKAKPAVIAKPLVAFTVAQVQRIAIQQPGQPEVELSKSGANWTLDQPYTFAADPTAVATLINSLSDITDATKVADVTPSIQLASFGLDPGAKTAAPSTITFGLSNGKDIMFAFGSDTPTGGNTYFRVGSGAIEMDSDYIKTDALKPAFDLQDKTVLHFPTGQITGLTIVQNGKTFNFAKSKDAWPTEQSSNIDSLISSLSDAQMDALVAPTAAAAAPQAAADGLTRPSYVITLAWLGGSSTLTIGNKTGAAEYFARNSSTPAIFKLSDYLISDITALTTPAPAPAVVKS
ncbi:MAG: DUF4340 domain-containing protein [Terriglobales bacterium]